MVRIKAANQTFLTISMLCCLVYFTSYMTRLNFTVAISEITHSLGVSNKAAGMAIVGSSIIYGICQPIFGILGDKFKPRLMILIGLFGTSLCNFIVSSMSRIDLMTILWCINGVFQAMLWPPLVRVMSQTLSYTDYRKANVYVASSASIGTIVSYVLAPFCIWIANWRLTFIIPGILGIVTALIWFTSMKRFTLQQTTVTPKKTNTSTQTLKTSTLLLTSGLLPIMLVVILQGALRDGITTWVPTYVNDIFNYSTSISILSTAVLPLFTILSVATAARIHRWLNNELLVSSWLWGLACLSAALLAGLFTTSAGFSILLMALITGCMHGINLMLINQLPLYFAKFNRASTISGILNAFTYVGSAISVYGIAVLSEHSGWKITMITWGILSLAGLVICIACMRKWGHFIRTELQQAA
ncbi:MFS transporter [Paenibacillus phocaensis]|uniref:MFS transporter n=1 Tax=Paenibacillus phocaensis TaxID=1776378 RepID=UPI000839D17F|nr:MFS transporter [Paenibacillus phocaensis]